MEESLNGNCHDLVLVVMVLVLVLVVMNWCDHTNSCLQIQNIWSCTPPLASTIKPHMDMHSSRNIEAMEVA